tara:strand:+ start:913 stop:1782 length:870 start_codon:yes stop_codon:yes gene_type:complete
MNPNFFIVGGAKCATTNISYYLNDHPDIFIPKLNEPYYYCKFDVPKNFKRESMITDKKKYLNLFKNAIHEKAIGEATPVYLQCPNAAKEIKKDFPDSKIIISIRNPIDKAHSSYFSYKFMNLDNRTFSEKINFYEKTLLDDEFDLFNFIEDGFFSKHIKRFQKVFPPEKIKIIFFEDYIKNISAHINSILNFLEIEKPFTLTNKPKNSFRVPKNQLSQYLLNNKTFRNISTKLIPTLTRDKIGEKFFVKQSTKPSMLDEDRERLKKIFLNEYSDLKNLLGIELPWKDYQ